ncbi:MAG TPA: tetratricopeptide repeat protein [Pyrinomonadaceae bacterium]|nr:tetratricopeptide repeat protein [Pyrinomonadaceae bacterium]
MRQCPECKRIYYDDRLNFCLDDGVELLHGPGSGDTPTVVLDAAETRASAPSSNDRTKLFDAAAPNNGRGLDKRFLVAAIGVVIIALGSFVAYRYLGTRGTVAISSVAVMPFVNDSGNPDGEYLSDGISETLINSLTEVPNLSVKPRSSTFRYKGREFEAKAIGSELGVGAIITGSLTQRGDDITLFVRLVDTASENQIWGKQYSRKLANLVTLQSEIARDVSESLRSKLTGAGEQRARKNYSADPEAYRLYLQGRYHWNKRSRRDIELAIDYFKQSTARDPRFAAAYAGLADSLSIIGGYRGTPAGETIDDARAAAQTALSLDPDSTEAHTALGTLFFYYDHNFVEAEREFRRAIELDPRSGHAYQMLGLLLVALGRFDEGLEQYRNALGVEPVSPNFNRGYALALAYSRRYDESIAQFRKTIELEPSFALAYFGLLQPLSLQGRYAESVEAYVEGLEALGSTQRAASLRQTFSTAGWEAFLRAQLQREYIAGTTPTPHFIRSTYFVQLGDKAAALDELDKSYNKREGFVTLIKVHPALDPLRQEPGFKDLVRKVKLPE